MKNIKKILALVFAALMLIVIAACASPAQPPPGPDNGNGNGNGEVALTIEPGILHMGTSADFPPYEFWEGGEIVGIDPEIAAAIAEKLGLELVITDIDFDALIPSLIENRFDIVMAALTFTEERAEVVNFSISYATGVQAIIVPEDSPITSVDDLFAEGAFHYIGVQLSTTGDFLSTWDLGDAGLASIERFARGTDAVMALLADQVDLVIIDNAPAQSFVDANPGLRVLETHFAVEDYAIALNINNVALLERVNEALAALIADGTVQRIIDYYIPPSGE